MLLLDYNKRQMILQDAGYSEKEIRKAAAQVHATLQQRAATVRALVVTEPVVEELILNARIEYRKMKRAIGNLGKSFRKYKQQHSCPAPAA
jgi:hypothetical protein